jgi:hypothetical protein
MASCVRFLLTGDIDDLTHEEVIAGWVGIGNHISTFNAGVDLANSREDARFGIEYIHVSLRDLLQPGADFLLGRALRKCSGCHKLKRQAESKPRFLVYFLKVFH